MKKTCLLFDFKEPYSAPECAAFNVVEADIICTSPFGTDPIGEDPEYPLF